jgi:8-oxo-dGTP pyrophosphatase MutT (NUDIX family)
LKENHRMPIPPYVRAIRAKIGHELLVLPSVTVMVFDDERRLLLAKSAETDLWITIGGIVEPDESPADAAVRECREETGVLAELTAIMGVFGGPAFRVRYQNGDTTSYVATVFQARVVGGEARPDGVETSSVGFFSREETDSLSMSKMTRQLVAHAFCFDGTPYFNPPTWQSGQD